MTDALRARTLELQRLMSEEAIDLFVLDDADSLYCFAGCFDFLGMAFGRATLLVVPRAGEPTLITPAMEAEMVRAQTWVEDVREWVDGVDGEWTKPLGRLLGGGVRAVAMETAKAHPLVTAAVREAAGNARIADGTRLVSALRMVKSPGEIAVMREAGEVAVAMVEAGREAIGEGVPEYELALAVIAGGTRKAASFLSEDGADRLVSPAIHGLQILQSGAHTAMVHRRSTVKRLAPGDPVYFCFCGIANFKQMKLGFDREFFLASVTDEQARVYETTVKAQQAALAAIRPGAIAEEVHAEAEEVYRAAGFGATAPAAASATRSWKRPSSSAASARGSRPA